MTESPAIGVFWEAARGRLTSAQWEDLLGPRINSSLRPPSMQLADDPDEATRLAQEVETGQLDRLETPTADFMGELPREGDMMIVCDGDGLPRVLVATKEVFDEGDTTVELLVRLYPVPDKKTRI